MASEMDGPGALAGATGAEVQSNAITLDSLHNTPETQRPQAIRTELSERLSRSGSVIHAASCSLATAESLTGPICKLARELLHLGIDPSTPLSIWRGRTKCFHDAPVGRWAGLAVEEGAAGTGFRRYKPFPNRTVASQRRESDG